MNLSLETIEPFLKDQSRAFSMGLLKDAEFNAVRLVLLDVSHAFCKDLHQLSYSM